jgi:hypothetical protein
MHWCLLWQLTHSNTLRLHTFRINSNVSCAKTWCHERLVPRIWDLSTMWLVSFIFQWFWSPAQGNSSQHAITGQWVDLRANLNTVAKSKTSASTGNWILTHLTHSPWHTDKQSHRSLESVGHGLFKTKVHLISVTYLRLQPYTFWATDGFKISRGRFGQYVRDRSFSRASHSDWSCVSNGCRNVDIHSAIVYLSYTSAIADRISRSMYASSILHRSSSAVACSTYWKNYINKLKRNLW